MKLVIAIIQPTKLKAVCEALEKIEVTRLTVSDAQGFGRQRGRTEMYRGHEYTTTLLRKVALEIVVNDDFLERTINTIIHVARTGPEGTIGDGKIFVLPAMEAIQIGEGSRGPGAVGEVTDHRRYRMRDRIAVRMFRSAFYSCFVPSASVSHARSASPWLSPSADPACRGGVFRNLRRPAASFWSLGRPNFCSLVSASRKTSSVSRASTSRRSR